MSNIEPNAGLKLAAAGTSEADDKRSWRTVLTSIVTVATVTVAVGLGLLYLLVTAPH